MRGSLGDKFQDFDLLLDCLTKHMVARRESEGIDRIPSLTRRVAKGVLTDNGLEM
jgi:hypothetical protein